MPEQTYGVYVLQIDDDPDWVYVGYSYRPPEERLAEHMSGHNAAWVFKRGHRGSLRRDLYRNLPRHRSRIAAIEAEAALAANLRRRGFRVEGGH
jgi:predicted GIY-YIG superfamily endonuclease